MLVPAGNPSSPPSPRAPQVPWVVVEGRGGCLGVREQALGEQAAPLAAGLRNGSCRACLCFTRVITCQFLQNLSVSKEPVSVKKSLRGSGMVLGAVACCSIPPQNQGQSNSRAGHLAGLKPCWWPSPSVSAAQLVRLHGGKPHLPSPTISCHLFDIQRVLVWLAWCLLPSVWYWGMNPSVQWG